MIIPIVFRLPRSAFQCISCYLFPVFVFECLPTVSISYGCHADVLLFPRSSPNEALKSFYISQPLRNLSFSGFPLNNFHFFVCAVKISRNFRVIVLRKIMTHFTIDEENRFSTQLNFSNYFIQKNSSADRAVTYICIHSQTSTSRPPPRCVRV
jgi:hypothetical protein